MTSSIQSEAGSRCSGPIIVTGARGRIASHLADTLAAGGMGIIRVSRSGGEGFVSYDELQQQRLVDKAKAIIHCAWSCLPATAERKPHSTLTEDLPLIRRLLGMAATRQDPEALQFVFLSSGGAVYGECAEPADERTPPAPLGYYGHGKIAAEVLLAGISQPSRPSVCVLRPSNIYGFRHAAGKPQGIVGAAINAVRTNQPLELLGGGASIKDFLHVSDFESAVMTCLHQRLEGTFNVCSGSSVRTVDVIGELEELGGFQVPRRDCPPVPWDVHCSLLNRAKLSAATGWRPLCGLRTGLKRCLRESGFNVAD